MSCFCDGNDPGCPVCHPDMVPEARGEVRELQRAQVNLLGIAAKDSREDADVLRAADTYRDAAKRANTWNALGTARKAAPVSRPAPHCQDALRWLKGRGWDLAPLTGQDVPALLAIAHCWQLWAQSDVAGQRAALDAVAALLSGCQEVVWPMARELVAQAGDWSHRDLVWPEVVRRYEGQMVRRFGSGVVGLDDVRRVKRLERCHVGLTQVHPS